MVEHLLESGNIQLLHPGTRFEELNKLTGRKVLVRHNNSPETSTSSFNFVIAQETDGRFVELKQRGGNSKPELRISPDDVVFQERVNGVVILHIHSKTYALFLDKNNVTRFTRAILSEPHTTLEFVSPFRKSG